MSDQSMQLPRPDIERVLALASHYQETFGESGSEEADTLDDVLQVSMEIMSDSQREAFARSADLLDALDTAGVDVDSWSPEDLLKRQPGQWWIWLTEVALEHGVSDDPDHEVGDLASFVRIAWKHMDQAGQEDLFLRLGDLCELAGGEPLVNLDAEGMLWDPLDWEDDLQMRAHFNIEPGAQIGPRVESLLTNIYRIEQALKDVDPDRHNIEPRKRDYAGASS